MTIKRKTTPRESDERTLEIVRLRADGLTSTEISRRIGKTPQFCSTATNRVFRADLYESGEDPQEVSRHYWGRYRA
jgi:hypothetical protein